MQTSAEAVYLDSSGLVKLVLQERESAALAAYLVGRRRVSCALARVEVVRAVRHQGPQMIARARRVLQDITLLALDDRLLDDAAELGPFVLRTLDAIHLAAARSLGTALGRLVTYDRRMIQAAMDLGFAVESPA